MSLFEAPPHTVTVWPSVETTDADDNPVLTPADTPVQVAGFMQPASTDESTALGQEITTLYRLICRSFPAGPFSRVAWGARDWDVIGEPQRNTQSPLTSHVTVLLSARGPAPI